MILIFKEFVNTETLDAFTPAATAILAGLAFVFSVYVLMREQKIREREQYDRRIKLKPILSVYTDYTTSNVIECYLHNHGLGPAKLIKLKYVIDNLEKTYLTDFYSDEFGDDSFKKAIEVDISAMYRIGKESYIPAQDNVRLFKITLLNNEESKQFLDLIKKIHLKVIYYNLYDKAMPLFFEKICID